MQQFTFSSRVRSSALSCVPAARLAVLGFALVAAASGSALAQPAPADEPTPPPWWERLTFSGDFRARYEGFLQDDTEARHRQRFRLRVGLTAPITKGLRFSFRLATGEAPDLTSTNQSLGDLLSRKAINIDQAAFAWSPLSALTLGAGKFSYPITRTQLTWDDDVNWEGTWEQLAWKPSARSSAKLVAVQTPLYELGGDTDTFLYAWSGELGWRGAGHALQLTVTDYDFRRPDRIAVQTASRGLRNAVTNRVVRNAAGNIIGYESGFNLVNVIAQDAIDIGRADYPLALLAEWVTNTRAAASDDGGLWLQARIGRATRARTAAAAYTFARIERDAVVSTFNFSDIPPTNVRMHLVTASYAPAARVNLDATVILTRPLEAAGEPWLTRLQIDGRVSF